MDSHWIRANFAKASTIMGFHGPVSINLSAPSTANSFNFVLLPKERTEQLQSECDLSCSSMTSLKTKPTKHILWLAILSWVFWEKEIRKQTRNQRDNKDKDILFLDQPTNRPTDEPTNHEPSRHQGLFLTCEPKWKVLPPLGGRQKKASTQSKGGEDHLFYYHERDFHPHHHLCDTKKSFDTLKRWRGSPSSSSF